MSKSKIDLTKKQEEADEALKNISIAMDKASARRMKVEKIEKLLQEESGKIEKKKEQVEEELSEIWPEVEQARKVLSFICAIY